MNNNTVTIPHLEEIKKIRKLEQQIFQETQIPIYDVSNWNPGKEYKKLIYQAYNSNHNSNYLDYHYSYEYNENIKVKVMSQLLKISPNIYNCVFIHSATAAICCIADYLKKHSFSKICVLEPAYFSVYSCLKSFGLNVYTESVILDSEGQCLFPYEEVTRENYDAIWITSPIYSTGLYYSQTQINYLKELVEKDIMLIIDESAATPANYLTQYLYSPNNIISFFSPHKYLSINSIKFAIIVCSKQTAYYFEDWIDVFIGSLPESACVAIEHYLSPNYMICYEIHEKYIDKNMSVIQELMEVFPDNFYRGAKSNYLTIQNKSLPYISTLKESEMSKLMQIAHVSFIPGFINGFAKPWGFCYRVNLTLDTDKLKNHLGRLFNYFLL
ncbi:MAG: hypothetical protein J1E03_01365 [Acetatifactor sp.]|nr:hypothetical protein [Acetatifactor sp.]